MPWYASYFKQQRFSDVDLTVEALGLEDEEEQPPQKRARTEESVLATATAAYSFQKLAEFPAHQIILCNSEYFEAQLRNWQDHADSSACSSSQALAAADRPALSLTVDNADQLPAAEAIIASMYGVEDAIVRLQDHEQVAAAVIADMINATTAATQAVQALKAAASSEQGLSEAALDALSRMRCWPTSLHGLLLAVVSHATCCKADINSTGLQAVAAADASGHIQRMLLAVFGDLQSVWENEQLQQVLLQLPLPAMQLLLSSDELEIPSEDTVLYTAQKYVSAQTSRSAKKAAKAALSALIRAPQLSKFALSCMVLPPKSKKLLLGAYMRQLRWLLSLRQVAAGSQLMNEVQRIGKAPASWKLASRQGEAPTEGVKVTWEVPVENIIKACKASFVSKKTEQISGPITPPLAGVAWKPVVRCQQQDGGSVLGLYVHPEQIPRGIYYKVCFTISCNGVSRDISNVVTASELGNGYPNFFLLDPMTSSDGWDAAIWAGKGLPTSGTLTFKLHVHNVC